MRDQLSQLLKALETELHSQGRWDSEPPAASALESTQPFAFDTLSFDQWLQWILLPRLNELMLLQMPLPSSSAIAPMAEQAYAQGGTGGARIVLIIADIDLLLTQRGGELN